MKNRTLRALISLLAVCLAPAAFAAGVKLNNTLFDSVVIATALNGDITLTTDPVAAPNTVPSVLPKASYDVTVTSLKAGATNIDTIPTFAPVNCTATPQDLACPQAPPPGVCGTVGQELVFDTINWAKPPGTTLIHIGKINKASRFTTTSSRLFTGSVAVVPATGQTSITRRVWISSCPGAPALNQTYNRTVTQSDGSKSTVTVKKCEVTGTQPQLPWSQEITPSITKCKLEPGTEYYLNYSNLNCGTTDCPMYRATTNNGSP